ncbi:hypothetical protein [Streptomyces sp. 35G-GA-8]|uniref:hypothetical protein n=1 Tax=Streptomyces sp. 35G-GA-8 TaxID=2939434 RepID=UPI00201EEDBE|nr:hypothetical protein [Streptomyces sp. 35G-GA-8]MCL7377505.1 hypothetical protein [Streptomyces sp. 35G-GA-8]
MRRLRSKAGVLTVLAVLAVGGTGIASAVQTEGSGSGSASGAPRGAMEPQAEYTGVIKGPQNANVHKAKHLNAEEWGLIYNTETVHLKCKGRGGGYTWYQLEGQPNRWIVGFKLEKLTPGIPNCL